MDYDTLERLRKTHAAWRILVADHASLILSFVVLAFIKPNRRAVPAPELIAQLDAYLDQLRETYPDRYSRLGREYLDDWASADRGFLRKYYPKSGSEAEFDLTPATERAIEWLQTLVPQQFIGTESRLLTLFQLLRDLAGGGQDDPAARIKELTRKRDEIDREIGRVRDGRAGPLDTTQIKERYTQVADTARRLLSDFRQVEENFRLLDTQMRERIAVSVQPKAALLEEIFGETDHIHGSDQGKSFGAFWEFLMSPARQDELREWLRAVHSLDAIRELPREDFVRSMPSMLLDAGEKVHGTVAQLIEQLRRFVDDQAHLENRRILDLIHEIETHAIAIKSVPPSQPHFAQVDGYALDLSLPMCRSLFKPPISSVLSISAIENGETELNLAALFAQSAVDERRLRSRVAEMLKSRAQVTLAEIAERYPPEQGLAEVVTYLRIAAHAGATIDETVRDLIALPAVRSSVNDPDERFDKQVRLPRIIFVREL